MHYRLQSRAHSLFTSLRRSNSITTYSMGSEDCLVARSERKDNLSSVINYILSYFNHLELETSNQYPGSSIYSVSLNLLIILYYFQSFGVMLKVRCWPFNQIFHVLNKVILVLKNMLTLYQIFLCMLCMVIVTACLGYTF